MGESQQDSETLQQFLQREKAKLESERANLEQEKAEFEENKKEWQKLSTKLDETHSVIRLNVGGTIFETSHSTLTSIPNTFFDAMFSGVIFIEGRFPCKSEDGAFFIDRDPFVFRHILNYLRGFPLNMSDLTTTEIYHLEIDASFYQLQGLVDIFPLKWQTGQNCIIDAYKITFSVLDDWNGIALSNLLPNSSIVKWGVKILSGTDIMVGIAPAEGNWKQESLYKKCGWYMHVSYGNIYSADQPSRGYLKTQIGVGSTIMVEVNRSEGQISFVINGKNIGVAFKGLNLQQNIVGVDLSNESTSAVLTKA